jgi:hypothetical protein
MWLIFVVAISMPITALASLRDFFDTAAVYWLSVVAGYLLWFWIACKDSINRCTVAFRQCATAAVA